jgi:hypothetical protein
VERAARRLDVILTHEAVQGEVCGRRQEQIRRGAGDREMFAERHRANAVDSQGIPLSQVFRKIWNVVVGQLADCQPCEASEESASSPSCCLRSELKLL